MNSIRCLQETKVFQNKCNSIKKNQNSIYAIQHFSQSEVCGKIHLGTSKFKNISYQTPVGTKYREFGPNWPLKSNPLTLLSLQELLPVGKVQLSDFYGDSDDSRNIANRGPTIRIVRRPKVFRDKLTTGHIRAKTQVAATFKSKLENSAKKKEDKQGIVKGGI